MNKRIFTAALCVAVLQTGPARATDTGGGEQQIVRAGTQASIAGPERFFTGRARIDPIWPADEHINTSGALVTFEPGARSAWHRTPRRLQGARYECLLDAFGRINVVAVDKRCRRLPLVLLAPPVPKT